MGDVREIAIRLQGMKDKAPDGCRAAADAMGAVMVRATMLQLGLSSHVKGTPTPSQPGMPPAMVGGDLRRSVRADPVTGAGTRWQTQVGATTVYARIHELGGNAGRGHKTHLPPRPYLRPALDLIVADGSLRNKAVEAFQQSVYGA